jgi:hypothetical protein
MSKVLHYATGHLQLAAAYRAPDGSTKRLREGVEQTGEFVEWVAEPGQYVLSVSR